MSIYDRVNEGMKDAMRAKDKERLAALRGIRGAFILALKEDNSDTVPDDRAIALLRSLAKQRKDSIDAYTEGGRSDLADAETAELAVIEEFLPKLADEATTRAWVSQAIAATGATGPRELGKVMGALMKAHKAEMEAGLARTLITELLGE